MLFESQLQLHHPEPDGYNKGLCRHGITDRRTLQFVVVGCNDFVNTQNKHCTNRIRIDKLKNVALKSNFLVKKIYLRYDNLSLNSTICMHTFKKVLNQTKLKAL